MTDTVIKNYECVRCTNKFMNKVDIERHLSKDTKCLPIYRYFIFNNSEVLAMSIIKLSKRLHYEKINNNDENEIEQRLEDDNESDDEDEKELLCKYCFTSYKNKVILRRHIKMCTSKDNFIKLKKLFEKFNKIKSNEIDLIDLYEVKNIDENFCDEHLSFETKSFLLLNMEPLLILEKLLLNKKNINILPINNNMSCIIYNKEVKKVNNTLLENVILFKINRYMNQFRRDLFEKKYINIRVNKFLMSELDEMLKIKKKTLLEKIENIIRKNNMQNFNYFYGGQNFNKYNEVINYFENTNLEFIDEIYSYIDENKYKCEDQIINYSKSGDIVTIYSIWENVDITKGK